MLLKYSTSHVILRIEMLTMKKFVIHCILAWFPFLQGLLKLCTCYPLLFLLPPQGLYPTEEQIVQHEVKKDKRTELRHEHFCDSHIYKCRSQTEKYAALKIFATWEFSDSLKMAWTLCLK